MNPPTSFILCATDFSAQASAAANVAAKFALRHSQSLQLVNVCPARDAATTAPARQRLEAEGARLRKLGPAVETVLLTGSGASATLLAHIRSQLPALVVVASGVKGAVDRWAVGSFSERIAESSPVPTLVVRNPAAFERWDATKDPLTILLALDLFPTSDVVLRWAKSFQKAAPCTLTFCHVNRRMPTVEEAAVSPGRPVNPPTLQSRLKRELHKKVRDQLGDVISPVIVKPFFGDPGPCIVEIAGETRAQLIAVGAHQRHGLSRLAQFSVSREVLHLSGTNVVCVPVTAKFDSRDAHIPDFRRVLVATDFSDLGNASVPFACAACCIGGRVKIIHVAKSGPSTALREQLRALIPDETGARFQTVEVGVMEQRTVADAICEEAESFGADLVCLSSHGLGASQALQGSVAKAVLKQIRRPMMVLRRPED